MSKMTLRMRIAVDLGCKCHVYVFYSLVCHFRPKKLNDSAIVLAHNNLVGYCYRKSCVCNNTNKKHKKLLFLKSVSRTFESFYVSVGIAHIQTHHFEPHAKWAILIIFFRLFNFGQFKCYFWSTNSTGCAFHWNEGRCPLRVPIATYHISLLFGLHSFCKNTHRYTHTHTYIWVLWHRRSNCPCLMNFNNEIFLLFSDRRYNNFSLFSCLLHRESLSQPQNIMYDKRVVRGSNYSQAHMQAVSIWNYIDVQSHIDIVSLMSSYMSHFKSKGISLLWLCRVRS